MRHVDWFFDFTSHYSYLQIERLSRINDQFEFRCRPLSLPLLLDFWNNEGPSAIGPKLEFTYRQSMWIAGRMGVDLRFPPVHPFAAERYLLLAASMDSPMDVVLTIFRAIYRSGADPTSTAFFATVVDRLRSQPGFSHRRSDADSQLVLDENLRLATSAGVFGTPTLLVDETIFWGFDATEMFLDAVDVPPAKSALMPVHGPALASPGLVPRN